MAIKTKRNKLAGRTHHCGRVTGVLWRELQDLLGWCESSFGNKVIGQRILALSLHLGEYNAKAVLEQRNSVL